MKKKIIEDMHLLATKRGGCCLSTDYQGAQIALLWRCQMGNQWEAAPTNVSQGAWCPICRRVMGSIKRKDARSVDL